MGEHERRTEDEVLDEQNADAVQDLDVQDAQAASVQGGQTGGSGGEDRPTESISMNFKK